MRGDRPYVKRTIHRYLAATPHARGSTPAKSAFKSRMAGYPACAGIDLPWWTFKPSRLWLPRMRGDRPKEHGGNYTANGATPHARGSTLRKNAVRFSYSGYPACAGIDLQPITVNEDGTRLPRMRGDRPHVSKVLYLVR